MSGAHNSFHVYFKKKKKKIFPCFERLIGQSVGYRYDYMPVLKIKMIFFLKFFFIIAEIRIVVYNLVTLRPTKA